MATEYDLVILGGGTGGYVAAIRASQLGLKTAIVEKTELGGTCLHRGCIPSKALLRSAEVFKQTTNAADFGVETSSPTVNFPRVQERNNRTIYQLHIGLQGFFRILVFYFYLGHGRILGPSIFSPTAGTISVEMNNGEENEMLVPKNVIIATGSSPNTLPGLEIDGQTIMTSEEALEMDELPESIIIVGGGVIGIEWASMLADFGVKVSVLEYASAILPTEDEEISKEALKQLRKKGIEFFTDTEVLGDSVTIDNGVTIQAKIDGETKTFEADRLLVSVGRKPNVDNIGLDNTDIETERGAIKVNSVNQTKESHIYAIGDVIGGMQLAHVASHEGILAVEHIANEQPEPIQYDHVASCVYSNPEIASVGLTEKQAKEQGYELEVGKFPFKAVGKALVHGDSEGFVKIISNKENQDILGIHMIGPHVTDMVSEAGLAMVLDATPWEIGETIHPHPTLSEVIGEAALAVDGKQIHG